MESVTGPNGVLGYTYNGIGSPLTVTTPSGTITYTYDYRNRLNTVTDHGDQTTVYEYDELNRLSLASVSNSWKTNYGYQHDQQAVLCDRPGRRDNRLRDHVCL